MCPDCPRGVMSSSLSSWIASIPIPSPPGVGLSYQLGERGGWKPSSCGLNGLLARIGLALLDGLSDEVVLEFCSNGRGVCGFGIE